MKEISFAWVAHGRDEEGEQEDRNTEIMMICLDAVCGCDGIKTVAEYDAKVVPDDETENEHSSIHRNTYRNVRLLHGTLQEQTDPNKDASHKKKRGEQNKMDCVKIQLTQVN